MASIFLSYRRTDGAQACRIREWLARRLGADAVFMDVENIPFAVNFPEYIKAEIESAQLLLALIGPNWAERIGRRDDQVRPEIELAVANKVPVLPILIGNTPMPNADQLPKSIARITRQNAPTVGILNDFDTHMRALLPRIEAALGTKTSGVMAEPLIIARSCETIIRFLHESYAAEPLIFTPQWLVIGTNDLSQPISIHNSRVTLFLHRVRRLAELVDLHFILSFWTSQGESEQDLAGWTMRQLETVPMLPKESLTWLGVPHVEIKIRPSDEDPRAIWRMITDQPLRLSLAYVATIRPT